MFCKHKQRM